MQLNTHAALAFAASLIPAVALDMEREHEEAKSASRPLSVGEDFIVRPFGGKLRQRADAALSVGATSTGALPDGGPGPGRGAASQVMDVIARVGGTPCRRWGAPPPITDEAGCPPWKKLCGAIYPYNLSVAAGSPSATTMSLFAKKWFWPLFWADNSHTDISVVSITFQGDPVFENGTGSGALHVSSLFAATGNYGLAPGLPAIDSNNAMVFTFNNANAGAQLTRGMFIGISIRN